MPIEWTCSDMEQASNNYRKHKEYDRILQEIFSQHRQPLIPKHVTPHISDHLSAQKVRF